MKNRQQRRHSTHPALPLLKPSSKKVPIQKTSEKTNTKGYKDKKVKNKNRIE